MIRYHNLLYVRKIWLCPQGVVVLKYGKKIHSLHSQKYYATSVCSFIKTLVKSYLD